MKILDTRKRLVLPVLVAFGAMITCCSDDSGSDSESVEDDSVVIPGWSGPIVETVDDLEAGCPKYTGVIGDTVFVVQENKAYRCYEDGWAVRRELGCAPVDIKECPEYDPSKEFCDPRDHQVYKFVKINGKTWMAENLNFDYVIDGKRYGTVCNDEFSTQHGRYYSWAAALDSAGLFSDHSKGCGRYSDCEQEQPVRGICPEGWHIPSLAEADKLPLKDNEGDLRSTTGWDWLHIRYSRNYGEDVNGKDTYGFSAFPSGYIDTDEKIEDERGLCTMDPSVAYFWIAAAHDLYYLSVSPSGAGVSVAITIASSDGLSIRCVKDEEITPCEKQKYDPEKQFCDPRDGQIYSYKKIGDQTWMTQNLRHAKGGFCLQDYDGNDDEVSQFSCNKYGRYYYSLERAKVACPKGWHLPKLSEVEKLVDKVTGITLSDKGCSGSYTDEEGFWHDTCRERDSLAWINLIAPVDEWCYTDDYIDPIDGGDCRYSPIDQDNIGTYNYYGFSLLPAGAGGRVLGNRACFYISDDEPEYAMYHINDEVHFCCDASEHYDEGKEETVYIYQCSPTSFLNNLEASVRCIKD